PRRVHGVGLRLAPVLALAPRRALREDAGASAEHPPQAERLLLRELLDLLRSRRGDDPGSREALRRRPDPLRVRLLPLGLRLPGHGQAPRKAQGPNEADEEADPREERGEPLHPLSGGPPPHPTACREAGSTASTGSGAATDPARSKVRTPSSSAPK